MKNLTKYIEMSSVQIPEGVFTPREFVAEVVKIFKMPSSGRTLDQRQFLHACGSLYKKRQAEGNLIRKGAQDPEGSAAPQAPELEGPPLVHVEPQTSCVSASRYEVALMSSLVASLEGLGISDPINKEASALAILLSMGDFTTSEDGEFGFEFNTYEKEEVEEKQGEMMSLQGGGRRRHRRQRGGGIMDAFRRLGSTVCGIFTGGVSSSDKAGEIAIDAVSAKLNTPGFFSSVITHLGAISIVFFGTGDPAVKLAIRIITQLNSQIDMAKYGGNVLLFGKNVLLLGQSLTYLTPKLVGLFLLYKTVLLVREALVEIGTASVQAGINASSASGGVTARSIGAYIKGKTPAAKDAAVSMYQSIIKRVCCCYGRKVAPSATAAAAATAAAPASAAAAAPSGGSVTAAANAKSDAVVSAIATVSRKNSSVGPNGRANAASGANGQPSFMNASSGSNGRRNAYTGEGAPSSSSSAAGPNAGMQASEEPPIDIDALLAGMEQPLASVPAPAPSGEGAGQIDLTMGGVEPAQSDLDILAEAVDLAIGVRGVMSVQETQIEDTRGKRRRAPSLVEEGEDLEEGEEQAPQPRKGRSRGGGTRKKNVRSSRKNRVDVKRRNKTCYKKRKTQRR
jgi:hypothetical protein